MFTRLYNLIEKRRKEALARKSVDSHKRVVDSFGQFGINIGPIPLLEAEQDQLKGMIALERYALDASYNPDSYVRGMYSSFNDVILLDSDTLREDKPVIIDHVLSHEYAHRLFRGFMSAVEERRKFKDNRTYPKGLLMTGEKIDPPLWHIFLK